MRDILSCAWKSLARKRLRTLLTAGSITIGVSMVAVVSLIGSAGKTAVNGELESLGISGLSISTNASLSEDGLSGLSEEDLALIRSTGNVETAMPLMIEYSTWVSLTRWPFFSSVRLRVLSRNGGWLISPVSTTSLPPVRR